jgi:hypothetical protein
LQRFFPPRSECNRKHRLLQTTKPPTCVYALLAEVLVMALF